MTTDTAPASLGWHRRFPRRWARERQAFRDYGWAHKVRYVDGGVEVHVDYPLHANEDVTARTARLKVVYPRQSYPAWMPVQVFDLHDELGVTRHRDPTRGLLCLVHEADHDPTWTAADLLAIQLPKLIDSNNLTPADRLAAPAHDLELPVAEPRTVYSAAPRRVVVPHVSIPDDIAGGALVLRQRIDRSGVVVTSIVDQILGPGLNIQNTNLDVLESFPIVVTGWWRRVASWDPTETADQLLERLAPALPALEVSGDKDPLTVEADPKVLTVVGLLVEDERDYGQTGPCWMFLLRVRTGTTPNGAPKHGTALLAGLELNESTSTRTPIAAGLADKKVAVVGVGAIGHHIATDLARTGVQQLDLVDMDFVDPNTRARSFAPVDRAGMSKAAALAEHLRATALAGSVGSWDINVTRLFEHDDDADTERNRRRVLRTLMDADLIVDATANPNATAVLNAVALHRTPLLTVAGTPGLWGGWAALIRPGRTGCTECLAHHRADHSTLSNSPWPAPPADADGWTSPVGCSEPTFTGTTSSAGAISHHASRVAIHHLAEDRQLGGDYYVATLHNQHGNPVPASWRTVDLPPHPACENHSSNPEQAE
ncbi:HesA/MoeB/ThiF family protein [Aeromicrobium fastidiosum]|uniref:HesA/MoeB/ThiF family protein n=1 Tax=Aeromicrobium fastidiosum TaxID=52699 RepID=UPI0020237370|nr:ThiF family adenylyltransferase [Aeromicrobium fastidiosum]